MANTTNKIADGHNHQSTGNSSGANTASNQNSNNTDNLKGKFETRCQICNFTNHTALNYRKRFDHSYEAHPRANFTQVNATAFSSDWFADSSTTHHMTLDIASLSISKDYSGKDEVVVGNGKGIRVSRIGKTTVSFGDRQFLLSNILLVPHLKYQLLSVQRFAKYNSCFSKFHGSHFLVKDETSRKVLIQGPTEAGFYKLPGSELKQLQQRIQVNKAQVLSHTDWRHCLGYANFDSEMKALHSDWGG